jgi:hypothetical protein
MFHYRRLRTEKGLVLIMATLMYAYKVDLIGFRGRTKDKISQAPAFLTGRLTL